MASTEKLSPSEQSLKLFGWAERAFAAFCMGIPFFLVVVDTGLLYDANAIDPNNFTVLVNCGAIGGMMLLFPYLLIKLHAWANSRWPDAAAFWVTIISVAALYLLFFLVYARLFTGELDPIRPSISQYASMNDAPIFGMLLTVPSMILIINGTIYGDALEKAATRASWYSIISGLGLFGVVVCPYYFNIYLHYAWALMFFAFAVACIWVGMGENKNPRTNHLSAGFMVLVLIIGVANHFELFGKGQEWLTLFDAESIGLWVIGAHYIITSFERMPRKAYAVA